MTCPDIVKNKAIAIFLEKHATDEHIIPVPLVLCDEILSKINSLNGEILIIANIEWLYTLAKYNTNNITFVTPCAEKAKAAKAIAPSATVITGDFLNMTMTDLKMDLKMKFDVIIGNPPYQDGSILLYPKFFKKCIDIGEVVAMLMPTNFNSDSSRLREHNRLVSCHSMHVSDNVTNHFKVGVPEIRYIIASKSINNPPKKIINPLLTHEILYPERRRVFPRRGIGAFGEKCNHLEPDNASGVPCIISINRGNIPKWRNISPEVASKTKQVMMTDAPWLLLVHENPSNGLANIHIMENDGTKWGSGVFAIDAESYNDAEALATWITSTEIQQEMFKLIKSKSASAYSMSGEMLAMIPHYK